jgi:DNA-binding transcriptional ArsR family regulator
VTDPDTNNSPAKDSQLIVESNAHGQHDGGSDLALEAPDDIEIISTGDERLKIIGKELADDTGRAIFTTICKKRIMSPADIARILGISLPLVNWHVNRLLISGLIRIEKLAMSQKNKPVKYYAPTSTIIIIGTELGDGRKGEVSPNDGDANDNPATKRRHATSAIWSRLTRSMSAALVSFITATSVFYTLVRAIAGSAGESSNPASNGGIKLADPDVIANTPLAPPVDSLPLFLYAIMPSSVADILIALLGGTLVAVTVLVLTKVPKPRR